MHDFRKLDVWNLSIQFAKEIYTLTNTFPKSEIYGITSQLNRSSVAIASNIAEGAGRDSNNEFGYFLGIALGSAFEVETQLIISFEIGYLEKEKLDELIDTCQIIQKKINNLKSVQKS